MKESIFNVRREINGNEIIFNTLTRSIVKMQSNTELKEDDIYILYKQGIYVDDNIDEFKTFQFRYNSQIEDTNYLTITYLLTHECNFECRYCYEGVEYKKNINRLTIQDFEKIFNRLIELYQPHFIDVNLFGGEPLLEIDYLIHSVKYIKSRGINSTVNIVSNGYLLDESRIKILKEIGVDSFQITIDGEKQTHDQYRVLKSGNGTYDMIYSNVLLLLENDIEVILNINYCEDNYKGIINFLKNFPLSYRCKIFVKFTRIKDTENNHFIKQLQIKKQNILTILYKTLKEEGYPDYEIEYLEGGPCLARRKYSIIIQPDGSISKCIYGIGNNKFNYGNYFHSIDDLNTITKVSEISQTNFGDQCKSCVVLPMCQGGCERKKIEMGMETNNILCEKEHYMEIVDAIIEYYK